MPLFLAYVNAGFYTILNQNMSPQPKWGGHIVFGVDPVGIGVRVASFPCIIF